MVLGVRESEPVQAGRFGQRRSGLKMLATCSLSRVSFSNSWRTSSSSTSRFFSRTSKASWWAVESSLDTSASTIAATASEYVRDWLPP